MNDTMVDSLSYKQLQALAMSLNLPGKMKQAVLVDAIKARQSGNENAVSIILEANRQRRIIRRQQQQQQQQQQLLKFHENQIAKRKCLARRLKRPADETDLKSSTADAELVKKAKYNMAMNATNSDNLRCKPIFFANGDAAMTGPTSSTPVAASNVLRPVHQELVTCPVWDDQTTCSPSPDLGCVESSFETLTSAPKPVDLLQPSIADCTTTVVDDRFPADSSTDSPISSHLNSSTSSIQPLQANEATFEPYETNGWTYDESFDFNASWKSQSLPNIKLSLNEQVASPDIQSTTGSATIDSTSLSQSSANSYFDDILNSLCRSDAPTSNLDLTANPSDLDNTDRSMAVQPDQTALVPNFTSGPVESDRFADPNYCSQIHDGLGYSDDDHIIPDSYRFNRTVSDHSSWTADLFHYSAHCFSNLSPSFRLQRPGNWTPITTSGSCNRLLTCVTFCNTLPRVSSISHNSDV